MDKPHSIAELLTGGAEPTGEEASDLTRLGNFVSRLLARHLGGEFRTLFEATIGLQPERMGRAALAEDAGFPLAAETGSRWERPTGLGATMLGPISGRFWDPEITPRMMAGFVAELAEFTTVELREEGLGDHEPAASDVGRRSGRRTPYLFGGAGVAPAPVAAAPVMPLAGTGAISSGALSAMAAGGLPLTDQLKVDRTASRQASSAASVVLDEVAIDQRTPALTAGLIQSSTLMSDRGLSDAVAARHELPTSAPGPDPVYGLYDAAESTFVGLVDVDPTAVSEPAAAPRRETPDVQRMRLQDVAPVQARDSGPLQTWTPSSSGPETLVASNVTHDRKGRPRVMVDRAGIAGEAIRSAPVAPAQESSPQVQVRPRLAEGQDPVTTVGTAQQADSLGRRSPTGMTTVAPTMGALDPETLDAPARPARHRRSLLASEGGLESTLQARRWTEGPGPEGFRPVVATPTPREMAPMGALDDGVWVAPEADEVVPEAAARPSPTPESSAPVTDTAARAALKRPVVTAREILAAAPWVASLAQKSASEVPTRVVMPDLVRRLDERHEPLQSSAVSALDVRSDQAQLVALAPPPLVRELQAAGWTEPEIARVLLALPEDVLAQDPPAGGEGVSPSDASSGPAVAVAGVGADTLPMARSLARILTGTEALSGPVVSQEHAPGPSTYFGAAAPERAPLFSGLREAIGELLALAQTSLSGTEPVASDTGETNRRQLSTAISRLSTVADVPVRTGYASTVSDQRSWVDLSADTEPATLASRLTAALEASGRGPAGAERLAAALTRVASTAGPERAAGGPTPPSGAGDVSLGATLAPESMLRGLVTPSVERRGPDASGRSRDLPGTVIGLSRTDRPPSGGRHRSLADFSGSWLRRVDGTRAGVDLGMDDTRAAFLDTFDGFASGAETSTMELAATSPIEEASVVVPGSDTESAAGQTERSPRRRVRPTASAAPRTPAGVAQRGDWSWVNTASRSTGATDTMADGLSSARSAAGGESMPLIAPAMHAVAHSAMRSANTEEAPGQQAAPAPAPPNTAPEPQPEAELSKEAFEDLAQRMADRISRRMRREKERRGQWT